MNITLIYFVCFILLICGSIPIAFALGISTAIAFILTDQPLALYAQRIWTGLDRFTLVAIPFFILAGELMNESGILSRLMDFSRMIIGKLKGGLLYINILVSMFFGGINGSAIADTSAIGSLMIKATSDEYGDTDLAVAVTAVSSVVGPIIPPSLPMLIYAFAASNVSIAGLFLAGIIPGVLLGLILMVVTFFVTRNKNYPLDIKIWTFSEVIKTTRRFLVAAVLPFIMVAGIVGGVVSPTEAGCVAILYALIVGFFVTRELKITGVIKALRRTVLVTAVVMVIIAFGNVSTWWLTIEGVPESIKLFFQDNVSSPYLFLLLMLIVYIVVGLFIEQAAAMIMLVPIFAPLAELYGIHPIHFGLFTCLSLALGLITPPVGICLFVASSIGGISIDRAFKASLPFFLAMVLVVVIVTFIPDTFLWLPRLFGY